MSSADGDPFSTGAAEAARLVREVQEDRTQRQHNPLEFRVLVGDEEVRREQRHLREHDRPREQLHPGVVQPVEQPGGPDGRRPPVVGRRLRRAVRLRHADRLRADGVSDRIRHFAAGRC